MDEEKKLYQDWKDFLQSDRSDLRLAAVEAVLLQAKSSSSESSNFDSLEKMVVTYDMVPLLAKNASHPDAAVSCAALKALVHLSSHGPTANQCLANLMDMSGINRLLEIVLEPAPQTKTTNAAGKDDSDFWNARVNFAMSLLANLTRTEEGAVELVGRSLPDTAVFRNTDKDSSTDDANAEERPTKPTLELLLARFLNASYIKATANADEYYEKMLLQSENSDALLDSDANDPYQHFAAVLMNSTQTETGRQFLLKIPQTSSSSSKNSSSSSNKTSTATLSVLQKILPQLRSPNPIRRRGIAGTIRNCCLERDSAWWFLNVVNLAVHLLYPLAGPEELDVDEKQGLHVDLWLQGPDKKREPDVSTRLFLVEAILLLCTTGRASRETLRLQRAYVILKWADMVEENETISERIYDIVNFLRRDEEGTAEGSSDQMVEQAYSGRRAAQQVGGGEDFDDVD